MKGIVIPVRASVAVVTTTVSLALLLSFKTPDNNRPRNPVAVIPASSSSPDAAPSPDASPSPDGPPPPSPSPSTASGYRDGQYTGQDLRTQFGDNQVKVIISGGRIVDVKALQLPYDRPRSAYISQVVGPLLHDEVLKAQSAQIDLISGATYTSDAYAQSLQSALDQARA